MRRILMVCAGIVPTLGLGAVLLGRGDRPQLQNVSSDRLGPFGLSTQDTGAVVVPQRTVVDVLDSDGLDPGFRRLDGDAPVIVAVKGMSGDSSGWCRRLSVEVEERAPGLVRYSIERPWWAEFMAGDDCREDAPAPGGVVLAVEHGSVDTRTLVIVETSGTTILETVCEPIGSEVVCSSG